MWSRPNLSTKSCRSIYSITLLSHLSDPLAPYLSWGQGSHSSLSLKLTASDRQENAPIAERRSVSHQWYWARKPRPLEGRNFNGNISHNQTARSSVKTRLTITLRLDLIYRETQALQRLPNAERTTKLFYRTWQSSTQIKRLPCTVATCTWRLKSSPNLLGTSQSLYIQTSHPSLTFLLSIYNGLETLMMREDADGVCEEVIAEFSSNSAILGQTSDIQYEPVKGGCT